MELWLGCLLVRLVAPPPALLSVPKVRMVVRVEALRQEV